jgi:hypothetical protein
MSLRRQFDSLDQGSRSTGRTEGIGPALQLRATALGDLGAAGGQSGEEGINMGASCGGGAEAGVGSGATLARVLAVLPEPWLSLCAAHRGP